jgi:hypothetical protein
VPASGPADGPTADDAAKPLLCPELEEEPAAEAKELEDDAVLMVESPYPAPAMARQVATAATALCGIR